MESDFVPSFQDIRKNSQNFQWIEDEAKKLLMNNPSELISYSSNHFGQEKRLVAIRACEKNIDLYHLLKIESKENSYLAVLPILWALHDECVA